MKKKYTFTIETNDKREMELFKNVLEIGLENINKFDYELSVIKSLHNKLDYSLELKEDE